MVKDSHQTGLRKHLNKSTEICSTLQNPPTFISRKALKRARRLVPIQHRSDDKYVFSYCEHLLLVSDHIIYPSAPKPLTEEVYWEATVDPNSELCTALTIKSNYN